jgi:hypothetical protein
VVINITRRTVDPDRDLASVAVLTAPAHGRAAVVGGSIRYTPSRNSDGRDQFDYRVCDVRSDCVTATVTVTILPVNDAPIAVPEDVSIVWAGPILIDVLANDTDVDGNADLDPTSVTIVTGPVLGTATVNATTGAIEYTASPGTVGTDQVTYRVCDLSGRCSTATLTIRLDVPLTPATTLPPPSGTLPTTGPSLGTDAAAAALATVAAGTLLLAATLRTSHLRRRPST